MCAALRAKKIDECISRACKALLHHPERLLSGFVPCWDKEGAISHDYTPVVQSPRSETGRVPRAYPQRRMIYNLKPTISSLVVLS